MDGRAHLEPDERFRPLWCVRVGRFNVTVPLVPLCVRLFDALEHLTLEEVPDLVLVGRVEPVLLCGLAHVDVTEHERAHTPQRDRIDVELLALDRQNRDLPGVEEDRGERVKRQSRKRRGLVQR